MAAKIKKLIRDVLHRIKVRLYPNYLKKGGKYVARTANNRQLGVYQVCESLVERGGYVGSFNVLFETARQFLEEAIWLASDGYAVCLDYFTIYPAVKGTFTGPGRPVTAEEHPVRFKFRTTPALREIAKQIEVDVEGVYEHNAYIDTFTDVAEGVTNDYYEGGNFFILTGAKVKIEPLDDPECGCWFVPVLDETAKVKARIAKTTASEIVGEAPDTGHVENKIVIVTRFSGGGTPLLEPRIIESDFTLVAM